MNIAASRTIQPNTVSPQDGASASESLQTDKILRNIREKLGLSGVSSEREAATSGSANPSKQMAQKQGGRSVSASSVTDSSRTAKRNSLDLNDHLRDSSDDDFSMNDMGFGSSQSRNNAQPLTQSSKNDNKAIEAAYKAYNGPKNYDGFMNSAPSDDRMAAQDKNFDIGSFEDFADYSSNESETDSDEGFDAEWNLGSHGSAASANQNYTQGSNVSKFQPVRPAAFSAPERANERANNGMTSGKKAPALYEQHNTTSLVMHMLQRELASYIESWAGQNQQSVTRYVQEACDQIAREWCEQNMSSIVNEWCNANLENLCADVIREELNRDYKTA